jgi:hypothetical protein
VCKLSATLTTVAVRRLESEPGGYLGSRSKETSTASMPRRAAIYLVEVRITSCDRIGKCAGISTTQMIF